MGGRQALEHLESAPKRRLGWIDGAPANFPDLDSREAVRTEPCPQTQAASGGSLLAVPSRQCSVCFSGMNGYAYQVSFFLQADWRTRST